LENTSADHLAKELLGHCLAGTPYPERWLDDLIEADGSRALFRVVVERLADLFEPRLCQVYADLFSEVIARRIPGLHAEHLLARYERVRRPRKFDRDPAAIRNVFVLSRVTLGADVAVTSVGVIRRRFAGESPRYSLRARRNSRRPAFDLARSAGKHVQAGQHRH
jgi:hypothetical protein